ncbi:MAG TPA: TIM44-like domain-containing protein [Xanthobacteraceae bacterium]|nr:TIM44-like domain-containing protein [Xanthobacteraceae bacterium]
MSIVRRIRPWVVLVATAAVLVFVTAADARVGGGFGLGSRGSRTFSAPPPTATAPSVARPLDRTMTQPSRPSTLPSASPGLFGGMFGRGLLGGLLGGFIGAGLFGLLFGHGLFGGMGGFASFLGLILQLALVYFVARLAWNWWQRRNQPAYAGASPGLFRNAMPGLGGLGAGAIGGSNPAPSIGTPITIGKDDFDTFERELGDIQAAYGAEDLNHLRARVTPEMLSYLADDIARNSGRGLVNRVSDVKLLQGDLAEAWREGDVDYATVAMRYSAIDRLVDRASGRVVEGDAVHPVEATELWTFRRDHGGDWKLSAIQQT